MCLNVSPPPPCLLRVLNVSVRNLRHLSVLIPPAEDTVAARVGIVQYVYYSAM